jgi:hypothetical protein
LQTCISVLNWGDFLGELAFKRIHPVSAALRGLGFRLKS